MNNNIFLEECKNLNIIIKREQISKVLDDFQVYEEYLLQENKKYNLTAITDREEIFYKHFLDSGILTKYIDNSGKLNVIDIGTGAGFPGVPCKIINNNINITLVDALGKRIEFLENLRGMLGLTNTKIIKGRAEELGHNIDYREKYDISISRGVADTRRLVEYVAPFVKVDGKIILSKSKDLGNELNDSINSIKEMGLEIVDIIDEKVIKNTCRKTVILKKIRKTDNKYPRKQNQIKNKPL